MKKKPHLILTSAYFNDEKRISEYVESIEQLKQFKLTFESITLIETISTDKIDYLEDSGFETYYTKLGNPYKNKGANWVYHISNFLTQSNLKDDDIVVFITGRYKLINENIISIIDDNMSNNTYDFIAKDDRDIYGGTISGVHTFFITFKKHKFLEFFEWYKTSANYDLCVEWEVKSFMQNTKNCLILNTDVIMGVETNVSNSNLKKIT